MVKGKGGHCTNFADVEKEREKTKGNFSTKKLLAKRNHKVVGKREKETFPFLFSVAEDRKRKEKVLHRETLPLNALSLSFPCEQKSPKSPEKFV